MQILNSKKKEYGLSSKLFFIITIAYTYGLIGSFEIITIDELLQQNASIQYTFCHEPIAYEFEPFPISIRPEQQPHKGLIANTFVLTIPQGRVGSLNGWVVAQEKYLIKELFSQNYTIDRHLQTINETSFKNCHHVSGRVAVIARTDTQCYAHWVRDILGRLAILEESGIEYDFLYLPKNKQFMIESLQAWGIDLNKVIQPFEEYEYIQADVLIVPSLLVRRIPQNNEPFLEYTGLSNYYTAWAIKYIRNKFLPLVKDKDASHLSKKVFISRKDSGHRCIINEDNIFSLFEKNGFKRYMLGNMTFLEQVLLFYNADIVVATHGSGPANLMFSKPGTRFLEMFQARDDTSSFYLSQMMHLNYRYIKTTKFEAGGNGFKNTNIPASLIEQFIKNNKDFFN